MENSLQKDWFPLRHFVEHLVCLLLSSQKLLKFHLDILSNRLSASLFSSCLATMEPGAIYLNGNHVQNRPKAIVMENLTTQINLEILYNMPRHKEEHLAWCSVTSTIWLRCPREGWAHRLVAMRFYFTGTLLLIVEKGKIVGSIFNFLISDIHPICTWIGERKFWTLSWSCFSRPRHIAWICIASG